MSCACLKVTPKTMSLSVQFVDSHPCQSFTNHCQCQTLTNWGTASIASWPVLVKAVHPGKGFVALFGRVLLPIRDEIRNKSQHYVEEVRTMVHLSLLHLRYHVCSVIHNRTNTVEYILSIACSRAGFTALLNGPYSVSNHKMRTYASFIRSDIAESSSKIYVMNIHEAKWT